MEAVEILLAKQDIALLLISALLQQHDYLERHNLRRHDARDPNGLHVGHSFGLHVMGGKLDEEGGRL